MTSDPVLQHAIEALAREPLRHIVLLKQLHACPQDVQVHRVSGPAGAATLVALDTSASPYDREAYPRAALAAFLSSDHPALTAALLPHLPRGVGIVFKLSHDDDLAPVAARFAVERRTAFLSFTSGDAFAGGPPDVRVTTAPGEGAFELFETQGHGRAWLAPLLHDGQAFAVVLARAGVTLATCFAFENYGPIWEVGGVVTAPGHRRQGLATIVVRAALVELAARGLRPRYQVEEDNVPSIALARAVGLELFLKITHYAHAC